MTTTGLFPGNRAVIVTSVAAFYKLLMAVAFGFPGFAFHSLSLVGPILNQVKPFSPSTPLSRKKL